MNPILRVASRDLEADGGGLWKCNLFMSARTFGIWKKVSTFLKMESFYLSYDERFLRLPQEVKCFDVQIRNPLIHSDKKCRRVCLFLRQAV